MKTTDVKTPTLRERIIAALANPDVTSADLRILVEETEDKLSETNITIERQRAFDLTKNDAATATRMMTVFPYPAFMKELSRIGRLKPALTAIGLYAALLAGATFRLMRYGNVF